MSRNIAAETEDERIVQLASSGVSRSDDGTVDVYLHPEEEAWTREISLRLTEDDALALVDALRQAAQIVAGSDPQAFIRLLIGQPLIDLSGLLEGAAVAPTPDRVA
jgi:hypothetical protein